MRGGVRFDPRTYLKIPFLAPERSRSRSSKLLKRFGSKVRAVHASFAFTFGRVDVSKILRLTFTVVVFSSVKILSETLREKFNGMSGHARVAR